MEQKYVRIPFDIELAREITNGTKEGRIITRNGESVRILSFDRKDEYRPIIVLIENGGMESVYALGIDGKEVSGDTIGTNDLMLEIPEYMTFKDWDILLDKAGEPFIYNGVKKNGYGYVCGINYDGRLCICSTENSSWTSVVKGRASGEERQKLIDALKRSEEPKAKDCLKKLGIEDTKECPFTFKQDVLVRQNNKDLWCGAQFSHKELNYYVVFGGSYFLQCIPYEGNEHLIGTELSPNKD